MGSKGTYNLQDCAQRDRQYRQQGTDTISRRTIEVCQEYEYMERLTQTDGDHKNSKTRLLFWQSLHNEHIFL